MSQHVDGLRQEFRNAMRRLASTVTVITCKADGHRYGVTATSLVPVSIDPMTLLICINREASLHEPLLASGRFCANLLRDGQAEIAKVFSGGLKGEARFEHGEWDEDSWGVPALRGAQASIVCTLVETVPRHTHSIFLGTVQAVRLSGDVSPLIYHDGGYSCAAHLPTVQLCAPGISAS